MVVTSTSSVTSGITVRLRPEYATRQGFVDYLSNRGYRLKRYDYEIYNNNDMINKG